MEPSDGQPSHQPRKERTDEQSKRKAGSSIITVESADKARNFFVDTLGFDHVMGVLGKDGQLDFVTVVLNGARLMFARPHEQPAADKGRQREAAGGDLLEVADVATYHENSRRRREDHGHADDAVVGRQDLQGHGPFGYEVWF